MNCPRPAKISFRDAFSKEKDCPMNFPRPRKIIRPLFGSSLGFVGLDGQKAYVMNFRRAIEKHLAA